VAVGALCALVSALKLGYSDSNDTQWVHAQKVARALSRGELPLTGTYLAGYHFNDALLRLDIAYENALRRLTRRRGNELAKTLIALAVEKGWNARDFRSWNIVRAEVNALKHRNPEQIDRQRKRQTVPLDVAFSAATNLVLLIERIVGGSR
jgi:hypothetical protein